MKPEAANRFNSLLFNSILNSFYQEKNKKKCRVVITRTGHKKNKFIVLYKYIKIYMPSEKASREVNLPGKKKLQKYIYIYLYRRFGKIFKTHSHAFFRASPIHSAPPSYSSQKKSQIKKKKSYTIPAT